MDARLTFILVMIAALVPLVCIIIFVDGQKEKYERTCEQDNHGTWLRREGKCIAVPRIRVGE